jgi:ribosomal protein S18 acetylase RimI-like enzyme
MEIRPYLENDRNEVISLWRECGLVAPQNDPVKDIERKLAVDRELFLVGVIDGAIVGSVMGGYEGHRGWINYLAVLPSQQRKGYGRTLLEAVEGLLRERGCPKINLQVRRGNEAMLAIYAALGYRVDDVIGMGKRLEHD